MDIKKLAPWNWFKKEQEQEGAKLPVRREETDIQPESPLFQIHREIDRLFDDAFRGFGLSGMGFGRDPFPAAQTGWLKPTLDVGASEKEYTVSVELPGVDQKDVRLELSDDTLRISGEKKQEKENHEKGYYRVERSYGAFQRLLSLPEDADRDNIDATFKGGVMTITIPRRSVPEKDSTKRIEIKRG